MTKSLEINSKLENINIVEKMIDEIAEELHISSDIYGKILIAVIEGVNNSIVHGNKLDSKKKVKICIVSNEDQLQVSIEDQGLGFDYANVPDPTKPENIENISGRGVFLMQKLADNYKFLNNGSKVELFFSL